MTTAARGPKTEDRNGVARVQLRDASKWYGNVVAVNSITCTLAPGITGLLGPNGAGKSTVLHMIAGLLAPSAGEVLIDGVSAAGNPGIYRKLGLVPEREAVQPFLTGYEFVLMNARLQKLANPAEAARRAVALVDLEDAQHRRVGGYSKGMRQRIKIAGALVHDPSVLLLDEPFNGMDPRQRLQMMEMLHAMAARGCTVLISSHILEELNDLAASVLVMVAGRLAASGHFREIRKLMTNRPHTFTLKSTNDRKLAAELISEPSVQSVDLENGGLAIRTSDRGVFTRALPRRARAAGISIHELLPTDESLESVFNYLVQR
ncbi:MAG: ABC transporter ATP-binding protein [Gemmatimonadaceae bacterium]